MTKARDMSNASLQEIFDFVSEHLLTQNHVSMHNYKCVYRQPDNGMMCAAGVCIPDDKYDTEMENKHFIVVNLEFNLGYTDDQVGLISKLQYVHDNTYSRYWNDELNSVASAFGLNGVSTMTAEKRR